MSYEFAGIAYDTSHEMHKAIADGWMFTGSNSRSDVKSFYEITSVSEFVEEVETEWNLIDDQVGYDPALMYEAFENLHVELEATS